jgi:hypothetical protein
MPPEGSKAAIPASDRPHTYALDRVGSALSSLRVRTADFTVLKNFDILCFVQSSMSGNEF